MKISHRAFVFASFGVVTCVTLVVICTSFLFQGQNTYQYYSRELPRQLESHPKSEGQCSDELADLRNNLTATNSRADHLEEEVSQLSYANSELEKRLIELQKLYKIEHQALMLKNNNNNSPESSLEEIPTIFMITPTYSRWTQKADLTRLCHTLMHVRNLHWIVVEDADQKSKLVTNFLKRCPVTNTHLNFKTSDRFISKVIGKRRKRKKARMCRGVEQRNLALQWLRYSYKPGAIRGVIYFGDDDNTYDLQLFEEMRYIKKVGVWPVGIAGGLRFEGPVCRKGKVIKWHAAWGEKRKFQLDFAGFAVNLDIILKNESIGVNMNSIPGYLESDFLSQIADNKKDLEAKADNCMKVYVWHTQTQVPILSYEKRLIRRGKPSNPKIES